MTSRRVAFAQRQGLAVQQPQDLLSTPDLAANTDDPLAELLRRAIVGEELVLHYQPIIDARSSRLIGAEALVRWESPDVGTLTADSMIPLAEACGRIQSLTLWVLNQAFSQGRAWLNAGMPLRISVNLSPTCLEDPRFARRVSVLLRAWDLPPDCLELELSEPEAPADMGRVVETLEQLRGMGVRIALARFGRGHSTLSRLQRLPVDSVKIDRDYIQGFASKAVDRAIVEGVIGIAHRLGCQAIATGVESEEAMAPLIEVGFDMFQGDGVGPALPADAFAQRWLAR
jgi:EAL domain-containing protein (putative c-di-GMP-specific phosphodiesterase class I)